jgi:hypothetical protein
MGGAGGSPASPTTAPGGSAFGGSSDSSAADSGTAVTSPSGPAPAAGAASGSTPPALLDAQNRLTRLDAGVTQASDDVSTADQNIANGG